MTQIALLDHHPAHRHLRMLGADLVFSTPVVSELARKTGTRWPATPTPSGCCGKGELVGVWPEGFKGIGKPFSERYKLQRFGRGGFVSAALRAQVPIVPCSIVGAEEIYPIIGNMKTLARLLGLPYVPVTPTFPWLGPLGRDPAAEQVDHRVRRADPDRRLRPRRGRRPDAGLQPHRPGARDDPAHALPAADGAPVDLLLGPEAGCGGRSAGGQRRYAGTQALTDERRQRARPTAAAGADVDDRDRVGQQRRCSSGAAAARRWSPGRPGPLGSGAEARRGVAPGPSRPPPVRRTAGRRRTRRSLAVVAPVRPSTTPPPTAPAAPVGHRCRAAGRRRPAAAGRLGRAVDRPAGRRTRSPGRADVPRPAGRPSSAEGCWSPSSASRACRPRTGARSSGSSRPSGRRAAPAARRRTAQQPQRLGVAGLPVGVGAGRRAALRWRRSMSVERRDAVGRVAAAR